MEGGTDVLSVHVNGVTCIQVRGEGSAVALGVQIAASKGHLDVVKYLLELGASPSSRSQKVRLFVGAVADDAGVVACAGGGV